MRSAKSKHPENVRGADIVTGNSTEARSLNIFMKNAEHWENSLGSIVRARLWGSFDSAPINRLILNFSHARRSG